MMIQKCNRCLKDKDLDSFYLNPSGKSRRKICKQCFVDAMTKWRKTYRKEHNARAMRWARANPKKIKEMNAKNYVKQNAKREEIKAKVLNDNPCIVCGETDQILLDFHHLDSSVKEYAIASHSLTWRAMLKEIAKCIVLCCKCHRKHHWQGMPLPQPFVPIDVSKYCLYNSNQPS